MHLDSRTSLLPCCIWGCHFVIRQLLSHCGRHVFALSCIGRSGIACLRPSTVDIKATHLNVPFHPPPQRFMYFAVAVKRFPFVALTFSIVFLNVLAPLLAFPKTQGFQVTGHLDNLLLKASSPLQRQKMSKTFQLLQTFGRVFKFEQVCSPSFPSPRILGSDPRHVRSRSLSFQK